MDYTQIIKTIVVALNKGYTTENADEISGYIATAERFFEMAKEDITNRFDKLNMSSLPEPEVGDNQIDESFMATRAGALGETFGEAPNLSQCCQQEIVDNDKCSHCGKTCKEMPSENNKLDEAVNKMKKLF